MSNITQNEISDSRLRKGKEKVGEGSSKERSDVWNYFIKELQPDGSQKAKCHNCEQLLCCDSKKHGTTQLKRHLEMQRPDGSCPKRRQKKALDGSLPKRPRNLAEPSLPIDSFECPENQLRCAQRNTELSGNQENHYEYDPQINEENILGSHQRIHQNEIHLGHDMQNNQEISRYEHIHSEYDARTNQENHLGSDQHIDPEFPGYEENCFVYDQQKNRELFVRMIIDNKSMLEHVQNPFLREFANTLQPSYRPLTLKDVEKECLTFYQDEKVVLKDKFSKLTSKISVSAMTSNTNETWCCVAIHFIDNDFKLVKRIIDFRWSLYDAERILNDWGLGDKGFAYTFIRRNFPTGPHCRGLEAINCIMSCLNEIAAMFYHNVSSAIHYIKTMMQDLNENPEKMCYFNQIALGLNLAPKFEFLLNRRGVMGPKIHIINDACTYKDVLTTFWDMNIGWSELEEVVGILNQINDVALMISSLELPTSNLLHKFVFEIRDILSRASPVAVFPGTKDVIDRSIAQLDKYLVHCNKIMLIASLLDPRFKLRFIKRCNERDFCKEKESFECFMNLYIGYVSQSRETHTPNCWEQIPELNNYLLRSSVDERDENFDVLGWWKDNKSEYPILSKMARDVLAIPISSSILSGAEPVDEIIDEFLASKIDRKMLEVLFCCNNWLRSGRSAGMFVAGIENIIGNSHINRPKHSNKGNSCVYDEKKCKELLVKLVISSKISFHIVENNWFIEWAKNLHPLYNPIDLATIKGEFLGFYQKERQRLQNDFKDRIEGVCISAHIHLYTDIYISTLIISTHYIDDHFNLVRRIIGTEMPVPFLEFKKKKAQVERCIANWGIENEVLAFTSNIYKKDIVWKHSFKLTCVQELLTNLLELIWFEFYDLFKSIPEIVEFMAKYSGLKHSYYSFTELANCSQLYLPIEHTSWALTFYYALLCGKAHDHFYYDLGWTFPSFKNWDEVKSAVKFLKPIYAAINILSSSKYPSSNLVLKIIFEIRDALSYIILNTSLEINKLIFLENLLKEIDSYLKDCNNILLVASLLDPRFKTTYMDLCYSEHISDKVEIDKYVSELLDKYRVIVMQEGRLPHSKNGQPGMLELERYLECNVKVSDDKFDVLRWWGKNKSTYPTLARMARDILAIPVSSVPSVPTMLQNLVNHFGPKTFEAMVCSNNWLSVARNNDEREYLKYFHKRATIDLEKNEIPPSYRCPLRVCDVWSLNFLEHVKKPKEIVAIGVGILTAKHMQCLIEPVDEDGPDRRIPDDVINCYIGIINNQRRTSGNVLILNTFDTEQLQSWAPLKDESEKPSECIKRGNDFLEKELVFLPICLNNHRFVGVINAPKKEFQILNSLNSVDKPYEEATNEMKLGIQVCIDTALDSKKTPLGWRPEKVLNWPISVIQNLPQQNDSCSCGLFALKYMQFWDGSELTSKFSQVDIDLFRKQLVGELIFSELNERKDIQNEVRKKRMHIYDSEDESDYSEVNSEDESEVNQEDESDESDN